MKIQRIQLYEGRPDVTLTTYILGNSKEMLNGQKRPGIVICPGGGYLNCSDREGEPIALRFAAMGYHAFVLRYSTFTNNTSGFVPMDADIKVNHNSIHPAPVRDLGKAFLTIRAHADEWLVNTEKLCICGFSAGAHNCAMYSVYWNQSVLSEFFHESQEAFRPAAAILAYGLTDYILQSGLRMIDPFAKTLQSVSAFALFGDVSPALELLKEVSPVLHVSEHTPPTFLWATSEDTLVSVQHTTRMANALASAGVPFEVHVFEKGPHGLCLADQASASSRMEIDTDAAKWVSLAESWLEKRFALPLRERPFWMDEL
ncbi:MAG: alpha/beta hydrolase [Clostridia bacterium]